MTRPSLDWEKLGRYLAGEASADEAAEMRRWLDEHPSDARLVEALDPARVRRATSRVDVEAALRRVKTRMHGTAPAATTAGPWRWRFGVGMAEAIAAAAAIILVASVTLWRSIGREQKAPEIAAAVHATGVGERKAVRLADGTEVLLGPASEITARGRDVQL